MIDKALYDNSVLSEIDNDIENIIITDAEIVKDSLSEDIEVKKSFSKMFRENLDKKFKTGDIVLVTNDDVSIKSYCLITLICGEVVPYVLSFVDYNEGVEINNHFAIGDLEMLSNYPELSESNDLIFFITKLSRVFSDSASASFRKYIFGVKEFLDKGLWVANSPNDHKVIMDKMNIPSVNEENTLFETDGKLLAFYDNAVYGPYNLVKRFYCEVASSEGNEALIYDNSFAELLVTEHGASFVSKNIIAYEQEVKRFYAPKVIEKTEEQVVSEILTNKEKDIAAGENDFLAFMDEVVQKEQETIKSKRQKKNVENFKPKTEVSKEEINTAIKENIMKGTPKVDITTNSQNISLNNSTKAKNAILNNPTNSYPMDWDYVYKVGETSRMYNPTVGIKYDEKANTFYQDDSQKTGMTMAEWNAYFIAHPELHNLIDETIGEFGGLFMSEQTLIDSGELLFNAKTLKFAYRHEYIKGNVYHLIDDLEAIKDSVIQVHKKPFYDMQMEILLEARPEMKKLNSADPKMIPFIHPLDEVVISFYINQAAGITYTNNMSSRLMRDEQKRLEEDVKSKIISPNEVPSMMEDYGARLQVLPITSFFIDWLSTQYGKIAEYGLPDIEMVRGLYFTGMSHKSYAEGLHVRGLIKISQIEKPLDVVSSSDYFEAKDSAKRFVNDLFQEFLVNEISQSDREQIEYLWNKRYNGYVNPNTWKLPVFIRHSKYFKNRNNKRFLRLSEAQIKAIKFATIENSSIMALEVGYGKAEWVENKIFTPTGIKKMGDLNIGDYVIGANGKSNMVIGTFPQGEKEMFKVSFSDNSNVIVCGEHLWQVQSMRQRSQEKYKKNFYVKTTKEILESGLTYERKPGHIQNRWAIPMTKPVEFELQNVFIEPYLLGLLLGDGCLSVKDSIGYSSVDKELVDAVSVNIPTGLKLKKKKNNDIDYGISRLSRLGSDQNNPLLIYLRNYGLQGKKSNNKFIPTEYKFNSVEVRLAILQGLLDTDGSAATHQIEYTTISKQLAEDVVFLTQSLGGTAKVKERNTFYTYKGEKKQGQLSYRLDIKLPGDIQPFRLQRKLNKYIPKTKYQPTRFITGIEYAGKLEAKCIKVEAQDSLYLTENFIVTHNTLVAIAYMSHCFETRQASNFLITVPKTLFVNKKWKEEVYGVYDEAKDKYIIGATPNYNLIELGNASTSEIFGGGKSKYKEYSENEEMTIKELLRLFVEIGGKQAGGRTSNSKGTATIPTNPYNYKLAVSTSNYAWSKLINTYLPEIDLALFNRCLGSDGARNKAILDIFTNFNLGNTAKDKAGNMIKLAEKIISTEWYYDEHLPMFGPDVPYVGSLAYDEVTRKIYIEYEISKLPTRYKKDKTGKVLFDKKGDKIVVPQTIMAQNYVLDQLTELHGWIEKILQRMSDFAIYEYGSWKFSTGANNIILATKEALGNIGFSASNLDGVRSIVEEITTYKNEENFDKKKGSTYSVFDDSGVEQVFKRNPQKVLQKQLADLMKRINNNMTEEGPRGKFFLENLKIDGFILDEAHIAKKIFTNVKTDASINLPSPNGKEKDDLNIKTTSHDIKGGKAPDISLSVFGVCQYIRSLGNKKPVMLLTATPFSNQPTEIFSMLSLVGINQLRDYGISNIKNFFDLFLMETLKYDFNQNGEFIKRITVEDFRNKELLLNLIWSVMDIKREASGEEDNKAMKVFGDKPSKKVLPKLVSDSSVTKKTIAGDEDVILDECEAIGGVNTIAVLNRMNTNTCSIVDQNATQKKMMEDIEKVATKQVNPKTLLNYTFEDFCPNISIFNEIAMDEDVVKDKKKGKKEKSEEEEQEQDTNNIIVALRTILNANVKVLPGVRNFDNIVDLKMYVSTKDFENDKMNTLYFLKSGNSNTWEIHKKGTIQNRIGLIFISDERMASQTISALSKRMDYGITFKALGISRAIALSPYLYKCNDLPDPTPENIIKYSPKIEYLVKALKSVKDHHIFEIPKKIDSIKKELSELEAKKNKTNEDAEAIKNYINLIPQLEAAREVSGQVVYMNMLRFNHYERDASGKATARSLNLADLIIKYIVDKGWFAADEVKLISSNTSDDNKEKYIKDFQEGKIKVLFGTPAIKEGVDLQNKASTMYIMTPDWNPTDMRQVEGRIWRRDNENRYVRIVYVLLDQSVEIFIYSKLEEKAKRLAQLMRERGTIAVLEEMSLNPNETKVALASDPEKRADIITKLCSAILEDQRNKINKNREELKQVSGTLEKVYENIEIAKDKYLFPYLESKPVVDAKYYEYLANGIVDLYINNKKLFLSRFIATHLNSYSTYDPNNACSDPIFNKAIAEVKSLESQLLPFWNWKTEEIYDYINCVDVMLDNRDRFVQEINGGANSTVLLNELYPLRLSSSSAVNDYLSCTKASSEDDFNYMRTFGGTTILYRTTDEMRDELSVVVKAAKKGIDSGNITRMQIKDLFEGIAVSFEEQYREYALNHPFLKPENYGQYIYYKRKQKQVTKAITPFEFDALDLPSKIEEMRKVFFDIKDSFGSFTNFSVNTQRDLIAGKNKVPYQCEIIVALGIASDDKKENNETFKELNDIFQPILRIDYTLKEIQRTLFKTRGMSMDDLPMLLETFEKEYQDISDKIIKLEDSRLKLITRFEKLNKERESISIDDIVSEFAKTNNDLNYKLQEIK